MAKTTSSKFATVENGRTVYPLLTEDVTYPTPSTPGPTGVPGGPASSVGQMVGAAMRDVLGVRPKDSKAFLAAINQSFAATEIEGRTEYGWTIRTGMGAPSDSGAFGVVQASVYSQAKASITQALTLIDGIYAIRVDVDPKDVEAIRAVVKKRLNEILDELAQEAGPRVQNVDQLFTILTGVNPTLVGSVTSLGDPSLLLRMKTVYGLVPELSRTIDEERNVTNFQVLINGINALRLIWIDQRSYFLVSGDLRAPLSTQLPRLWRHMDFLAERLQQVYFIMDSVYLGPAERQVIEIDLTALVDPTQDRIFLSDLLAWLQDAATGGGRALIEDGGKEGIRTYASTISQLHDLFYAATNQVPGGGIPDAYFEKRVQESLTVLLDELAQTLTIALTIAARPSPTKLLESTLPVSVGSSGVLIVGSGFYEGMSASAIGYSGRSVTFVSESLAIVS
jgi:hypothetical protein